ncbi:hypothetical protein D3C85_1519680 [compost metagenome]
MFASITVTLAQNGSVSQGRPFSPMTPRYLLTGPNWLLNILRITSSEIILGMAKGTISSVRHSFLKRTRGW